MRKKRDSQILANCKIKWSGSDDVTTVPLSSVVKERKDQIVRPGDVVAVRQKGQNYEATVLEIESETEAFDSSIADVKKVKMEKSFNDGDADFCKILCAKFLIEKSVAVLLDDDRAFMKVYGRKNLGDCTKLEVSYDSAYSSPNSDRSGEKCPTASKITCDFCGKICETENLLKQHTLESHVGGFCGFYCPCCKFEHANRRRVSDHCRTSHDKPIIPRRAEPSREQKLRLHNIQKSLAKKCVDLDLSRYGI